MFTATSEYSARGDDGVLVRVERSHITYVCGDRRLTIKFDYLIDDDAILIDESSVRAWDTPQSGELIASIERQGILKNLMQGLSALGFECQLGS